MAALSAMTASGRGDSCCPASPRTRTLFDFGWRFHRGGAQGAEEPGFDDSRWRSVDLPHDWSIENLPGAFSALDSNAITQVSGGFTTGGIGWYRKTFVVPAALKGKLLHIQFDGVYMNADVWINGHHLGRHPYGYTSFWYDVTSYLNFGEKNVLAVKVANVGKNSRWYSGSGIYRHVWLSCLDSVHIAHWGVSVNTAKVSGFSADVAVKVDLRNEPDRAARLTLVTRILDREGHQVAGKDGVQSLSPHGSGGFEQTMTIDHPHLWSVDSPYLYHVVVQLFSNGKVCDEVTVKTGIRSLSFDAARGFRLNGIPMKLKGGCIHHDNGPLGSRSYDAAELRKVALLKSAGFNAIRCAHNPPSPGLLNACDSLGMLVIDEAFDMWEEGKTPYDYHLYFSRWWKRDIDNMVLRDRNHPCVILWSIGNEIPGMETPGVVHTADELADEVRAVDPSRLVTAAVNNPGAGKDSFFSALDVCGYNYGLYRQDYYLRGHQRKPGRVMFGSESFPPQAFAYWMAVKDHPWIIGDFVWTAWDYIGEAGIGWFNWPQRQDYYPWHLAYTGDFDVCGWRRPQSYYRETLWKKDQLSLFVKPPEPSFRQPTNGQWSKWRWEDVVADWNWHGYEGTPLEIHVYSSCQQVELFLNGKSLGKKNTDSATRNVAVFEVPYEHGLLRAVGYDGGRKVKTAVLQTAGKPARIKLSADRAHIRADGEDLCYITAEITDDKGVRCPKASNLLHFHLSGPGAIAAVGNADPVSRESWQAKQRKGWKGRCLVIVSSARDPGTIRLTVSSNGLASSGMDIRSD
jgi:beta-galactosidase